MLSGAQNADRSAEMRRKTLTVRQKMRGWLGWRMLSGAQNADRSAETLHKMLTVRQKMRGWLGWLTGWGSFFSAQRYAFSVAFLTDGSYFVSRHPSPRAFSVQRYVFSVATKHLHAFSARRLLFPTPIVLPCRIGLEVVRMGTFSYQNAGKSGRRSF